MPISETPITYKESPTLQPLSPRTQSQLITTSFDNSFTAIPQGTLLYINEHLLVPILPVPRLLSEDTYLVIDLRANQLYLCTDPYPLVYLRTMEHHCP